MTFILTITFETSNNDIIDLVKPMGGAVRFENAYQLRVILPIEFADAIYTIATYKDVTRIEYLK